MIPIEYLCKEYIGNQVQQVSDSSQLIQSCQMQYQTVKNKRSIRHKIIFKTSTLLTGRHMCMMIHTCTYRVYFNCDNKLVTSNLQLLK